jgi:hypothetical protein
MRFRYGLRQRDEKENAILGLINIYTTDNFC